MIPLEKRGWATFAEKFSWYCLFLLQNLIANEKIKSHESDIESLRHQVLTLEQQLESCRKSNDNLQEDLNAVQSKHLEALNVINEMENKCMGLENKIERLKETVSRQNWLHEMRWHLIRFHNFVKLMTILAICIEVMTFVSACSLVGLQYTFESFSWVLSVWFTSFYG